MHRFQHHSRTMMLALMEALEQNGIRGSGEQLDSEQEDHMDSRGGDQLDVHDFRSSEKGFWRLHAESS